MRPVIALAAALAALSATAAPAQDMSGWPQFSDNAGDGISISIDPASITKDGNLRNFRGRMAKQGDPRSAILTMVGDCSAQTLAALSAEIDVDGKHVDIPNAGEARVARPVKGDASATAILAYVCKP